MILNDWEDWSFEFHLFLDGRMGATTLTASGFLGVVLFCHLYGGTWFSIFLPSRRRREGNPCWHLSTYTRWPIIER